MKQTKQQQLDTALTLWTMYIRGAMRPSPAQMRRLDAKIARLRGELAQEATNE